MSLACSLIGWLDLFSTQSAPDLTAGFGSNLFKFATVELTVRLSLLFSNLLFSVKPGGDNYCDAGGGRQA
jgi:hypothetical protein